MPQFKNYNEHGLIIPHDQLSPQALKGLIEEFVTRDGTDNGYTRASPGEKRGRGDGGPAPARRW